MRSLQGSIPASKGRIALEVTTRSRSRCYSIALDVLTTSPQAEKADSLRRSAVLDRHNGAQTLGLEGQGCREPTEG